VPTGGRLQRRRLDKTERQSVALERDRQRLLEGLSAWPDSCPEARVHRSTIDPTLKQPFMAREVERVREQRGARLIWVYSPAALEGPIAGLDAAFPEGEAGGTSCNAGTLAS
jgi:hypothetical protein